MPMIEMKEIDWSKFPWKELNPKPEHELDAEIVAVFKQRELGAGEAVAALISLAAQIVIGMDAKSAPQDKVENTAALLNMYRHLVNSTATAFSQLCSVYAKTRLVDELVGTWEPKCFPEIVAPKLEPEVEQRNREKEGK